MNAWLVPSQQSMTGGSRGRRGQNYKKHATILLERSWSGRIKNLHFHGRLYGVSKTKLSGVAERV
jgi:hypothetical protein